ncbi:extracellular solute-binding protein [Paenibacillus sp. LHD-117]|uniref:ABC transporter substrate-binding protein n=1 Tax=Paenibacillus sp. LHD-117 TaxID=3071412 RepID=UPI0027E19A55|nr:extracellular solute-binding protein [Paenibacillus sp. LHD-117]MDQ6420300.1 extracellular solute-binding protein [Paenibacillus sp. LHD-117]
MNKNVKSWAMMLATVMMTTTVLSACSGGNGNAGNAGNAANTGNAGNGSAEAEGNEVKEEELVKLANGNITVLYHTSLEQYQESKTNNPDAYDALLESIPEFEKQHGGKVNLIAVPWGDQKATLISMVNAGEQVDVAQANDQNFPVYPLKKMLMPLGDYIDLADPLWNSSVLKAFEFGGEPYAAGVGAAPIVIYYNKTLFENNGVKSPSELYAEGNWTWETFRSTAMEMTQDTDGDGASDQFGFGWWDAGYALMVASNGKTLLTYNEDGTISANHDSDNVKEAVQFTQDALLKDKYIDKDKEGDYFNAEFKNGKLAMTAEYGFGGFNVFKSDYEIDFVPVPKGPKGEPGVGPGGMSGWSIPTVSKNPEGAAAFIKLLSENEQKVATAKNVELYGQEKVDFMNELAGKILFAPIGVEKYWDANTALLTGIKDGTPVGTFAATAKAMLEEGINITLTQ